MMRFLNTALGKFKAVWEFSDPLNFTPLDIEHHEQLYHVEGHARYVLIVPASGGEVQYFSTDKGEPHYELAREAFDGFEWNLPVLHEMIGLAEKM